MGEIGLGGLKRRHLAMLVTLIVLVAGAGVYRFRGQGDAPPLSVLALGRGMTQLGNNTAFDSVIANQGGPHLYVRNSLVEGPKGESAPNLLEREIAVATRGGWGYLGSVGADRYGDATLVRAGTRGAVSYALDRSRQICATLETSPGGDSALARLNTSRDRRDLLYITLERNTGSDECSLPADLRGPAIQ